MKRLILLVAILTGACGAEGTYTTTVANHPATVISFTNENFNVGGAATGALLGGAMHGNVGGALLWGAAMGSMSADGCRVSVQLESGGTLALKSDPSMCDQRWINQHVMVHEKKVTETYKDGSTYVWSDEWGW